MTEADALTATQAAIWSNSNGTLGTQDGKDGTVITGIYSVVKPKDNLADCNRDYDTRRDALLKATYEYLMALEGIPADETSVVINEDNFTKDMSLTVGEKVGTVEGTENGLYNTSLNFKLAFVPSAGDDLLVQISYTDYEGNPVNVIRRLAGTNGEGEYYSSIVPDETGTYVISDLVLSENQNITFDLNLKGTQFLKQGVYIYKSFVSDEHPESQTMVGIAEGQHQVSVDASLTVSFSVDEEKNVVAKREWHEEGDPTQEDREEPEEREEPPVRRVTVRRDTTTIPDEAVPLAEAPKTGDASWVLIVVAIAAALGLTATFVFDKKRKNNR